MPRPPSSPLQRYGYAIALIVVATAARQALGPALGERQPFATFYIAVILSAWYGGLGPSIVAMTLGGLSALFFFLAPMGTFSATWTAEAGTVTVTPLRRLSPADRTAVAEQAGALASFLSDGGSDRVRIAAAP